MVINFSTDVAFQCLPRLKIIDSYVSPLGAALMKCHIRHLPIVKQWYCKQYGNGKALQFIVCLRHISYFFVQYFFDFRYIQIQFISWYLTSVLDNREIKNIDKYKITSGLFNVSYPSDPVFVTNSNFSQAVSDGWYIMLEPLRPGQHELKFSASQVGAQTTGESTALDVTYHLTVK